MSSSLASIAVMAFCLAISMPQALAWGVAHENSHIELEAGEEYQFYTSLQNMVGNTSYNVQVSLSGDTSIATLSQNQFTLEPQTQKLPIYITLKPPPENPQPSYSTIIKYSVSPTQSSGQVGLNQEKTIFIHISVKQPEPEPEPDPEPEPEPQSQDQGSSSSYTPPTHQEIIIQQPNTTQPPNPQNQEPPTTQPPKPQNQEPPTTNQQTTQQDQQRFEDHVTLNDINPIRFPFEYLIPIVIICLIGYMLLPPKENEHEQEYY